MASLTLSSLNFLKTASTNSPDMIIKLAEKMRERGIKPEIEVFDFGVMNFAHYLIKKEIIEPPYCFKILLGNIATAQAKLLQLGLIISELPENSVLSIAGIEDNFWYDEERTRLATNYELVQRLIKVAAAIERPIAPPLEVRELLKLRSPK